ncbi:thioredoxin [Phaeobacter gallaeciensis]|uniref:Thioredoxin n=2 Tax=Roseobacteraceae TaxID=2854170 RepID=A0A366WS94_9RHOB|nr:MULTISPECIES: zinc-ribbon domain-containing protein [Roseobacteraceae]MBT3141488.1 zinc-ribbon domain-containing protein [Falsiruegeria litorea]RBW50942.1 thioredoxin [Phaeobacter gallaeciensis]
MRLTCPNCGAQYEVPIEVIPQDGRDVQCSNCGDTWFQEHPDKVISEETHSTPDSVPSIPDDDGLRAAVTGQDIPQTDPDPAPQEASPEPAVDTTITEDPEPVRRDLSPDVSEILREEASREADLRATETQSLESQPELGLDAHGNEEPERRAREAQNRMARIRGETPSTEVATQDAGSRRGLLPDIEEINSTLRNSTDKAADQGANLPQPGPAKPRKSGGFLRGFSVIVIIGVILAGLYINAPTIAQSVPQADPMLSAYVALVDQARLWLDAQAAGFVGQ